MTRALIAVAVLLLASPLAHAQCYDATIGHQLADVKGTTPVEVVYNATPGWKAKYEGEALSHKGQVVTIDHEPNVYDEKHQNYRPLDPRHGSLDKITIAHRELYDALETIRLQAKKQNTRIGVYGWFEHTPQNPEFILDEPTKYFANVQKTATLQVYPGKTVRDQLKYMGGVNWTDNYVPDGWNNDTWGLQKFLVCCERKANALEAAGVPSVPQIRPVTVGAASKPVKESIVRAWVLWARYRYGDQWAVWAAPGEVTPEFKEWIK